MSTKNTLERSNAPHVFFHLFPKLVGFVPKRNVFSESPHLHLTESECRRGSQPQSAHVRLDGCQLVQLDFGFNHPVLLIREERDPCLCVLFQTPSYFSSSFPASDFSASSLSPSAGRLVERMEKVQRPERNDMRLIKRVAVITQGQGLTERPNTRWFSIS